MNGSMLKIEGLTKRFGGLTAVDNLSLDFPEGKLHAVIGPNGAGKTTLFNLITGLLKSDSGRVTFRNHDISGVNTPPAKAGGFRLRLEAGYDRPFGSIESDYLEIVVWLFRLLVLDVLLPHLVSNVPAGGDPISPAP